MDSQLTLVDSPSKKPFKDKSTRPTASQVTLVDPAPPLELEVESNAISNTRLLVHGTPRYKVSTLDNAAYTTDIIDLETNSDIASIRIHNFRADTVRFPGRIDVARKEIEKDRWIVQRKGKNEM